MSGRKVSTKPPSGMRDFLPEDIARREHVTGVIRGVYERYGFVPLETPAVENLAILLGKYGEDEKLIYRLLHRGEVLARVLERDGITPADLADQALRYDLTVPLARVVAQYGALPRYFKRYQIQPVWRADRPGKGRFREFYQCDVDILGTTSLLAEAEVMSAVAEALSALGFADYEIRVGHRALLRAVIRTAGIDEAREATALQAVDKFDKIGRDGVLAELSARGIEEGSAARLLDLIASPQGEGPEDDARARLLAAVEDPAGRGALDELARLAELLEATPVAGRHRFDPRLARGLGYYTGAIFEVKIPGYGFSFAGGGRYDGLVGMFGKKQVPAVGCSIGLERILVVMDERGMYPDLRKGPDVYLCWMDVAPAQALARAHELRALGLRVEVHPEPTKLGKQLQYASSPAVAAPFAAILGEDELAAGQLTLKDLTTGQQERLSPAEVAARVAPAGRPDGAR